MLCTLFDDIIFSVFCDIRIGYKVEFVCIQVQSTLNKMQIIEEIILPFPTLQPTETALPSKPPRKRHPSFDLQALLAPRRGTSSPKPAESPVGGPSRNSPMSWLGRRAVADPVITTSMATAISGWGGGGGAGGGGGVLIRGVEVSSKEVVYHTGSPRQHVLLSRSEREMGADRAGSTAQRCVCDIYLLFLNLFRLLFLRTSLHSAISSPRFPPPLSIPQ